jgi:hypothetical protein
MLHALYWFTVPTLRTLRSLRLSFAGTSVSSFDALDRRNASQVMTALAWRAIIRSVHRTI